MENNTKWSFFSFFWIIGLLVGYLAGLLVGKLTS